MKKTISLICSAALIMALAGCNKKDSLYGECTPPDTAQNALENTQSIPENAESTSERTESSSDNNALPSPVLPDIPRQKISEIRNGLENQVETVRNANYTNLQLTDDFVAKVPDSDVLYDLTFTAPKADFQTYYEKFDKTFDREFGDVYTDEDKKQLYHVHIMEDSLTYLSDSALLSNHIDKFLSGEENLDELYVDTDKAYLAMFKFSGGIHGLNHGGVVKRAKDDRKTVALSFGTDYFDIVKNYLDVDSDDKFEILDAELSVKEAAEMAKSMTEEYGYSFGGSVKPEVCQVKVLNIGEGKYGFSFTMTGAYKGVMFDAYEKKKDGDFNTRGDENLNHDYDLFSPNAFMMEKGKFDSFTGGISEYTAKETAAYDSVIPFEEAARIVSEKFGVGMSLSVSRADLIYSAMYRLSDGYNPDRAAFPVWKFRCYNTTDNYKYVIFVDAVRGNVEYYITDWWEAVS